MLPRLCDGSATAMRHDQRSTMLRRDHRNSSRSPSARDGHRFESPPLHQEVRAKVEPGNSAPLRRDRREQLTSLRQPDGDPVPPMARARIERLLDRDLVLKLIEQVEAARDAVLTKEAPANDAEKMIRSLTKLRSIGPDFTTLLVREAFVRQLRSRRALGGYVGLGGTPFSSGGSEREQGIGKDGNRRLRAAMVELAWTWLRWQSDSALSVWFRARVGAMGGRIKKIMIVALARKLLVALWRYVMDGVIPDGAKPRAA
jgi:transposase